MDAGDVEFVLQAVLSPYEAPLTVWRRTGAPGVSLQLLANLANPHNSGSSLRQERWAGPKSLALSRVLLLFSSCYSSQEEERRRRVLPE